MFFEFGGGSDYGNCYPSLSYLRVTFLMLTKTEKKIKLSELGLSNDVPDTDFREIDQNVQNLKKFISSKN